MTTVHNEPGGPATPATPGVPLEEIAAVDAHSTARALRKTLRKPVVLACLTWLALVVLSSVFADLLSTHEPLSQDLRAVLKGPSGAHWLGTDSLGRDVYSRLLHGGGYLLLVALLPLGVSFLIGIPTGLRAGYVGGKFDLITGFIVNVLFSIPGIVVILAVAVISDSNLIVMSGVLGVLGAGGIFRLVRASTQAVRGLLYVDAARVVGLKRVRILFRHVLPNVVGPLIVQAFLLYSGTFIFLTSLSFLGLGFSPETPSWGQMVFDATQNLNRAPWLMVPIGISLILTALSLNLIGTAVLQALPKAQRGNLLIPVRRKPPAVAPSAAHSTRRELPTTSNSSATAAPHPAVDAALLVVNDLTVSFATPRGLQPVVEGVSFSIERGRTLGLVGESGSGKSVTSLALMGLVPPPGQIAGEILLDGTDLVRQSARGMANMRGTKIAMISQEPMVALDPCFSIGSQLRETIRQHTNLRSRAANNRALELLRLVGITDPQNVARSHPHQISGGMAQRVAIAQAISGEPELLIADEPTTALDVTVQAEILDLLRGLQRDLNMGMLLVTHDLGVAADICDHIAVMYAGEIVEIGSVEDVLLRPKHPYSAGLLDATPDLVTERSELARIPGTVPLPQDWPAWCRFANRCPLATEQCRQQRIPLIAHGEELVRCIHSDQLVGGRR